MTDGFDFDSYWKAWILSRLAIIEKNIAAHKAIQQSQQQQILQPTVIKQSSAVDQSHLQCSDDEEF